MGNQVIQATLGIRQGQKAKKVKRNIKKNTEGNKQHRSHKKTGRNPGLLSRYMENYGHLSIIYQAVHLFLPS
jgi:hypothetical protein